MRVLAVLYCYPPLLVPAAMCYVKLMAGLRESGVDVEILTIAPDSFASPGPIPLDESLSPLLPEGIINHVVRSPELSFWVKVVKRLDTARRFSRRWLEPKKREWTFPGLRYLRQQNLDRFDVVLTCSQPHSNHLLGLELQQMTGLPWIAYFSDPWTENPYATYPSDRIRSYHRQLENRVLAAADVVLFTCDEMRRLVADNHAVLDEARTGVLPHAFIPAWYRSDRPTQSTADQGPIRMLHTGSFYGPRTPLPLIDALIRVSKQIPLEGRLQIDSYGGMEDKYRRMIEEAGLSQIIRVHGFIPYLETLTLMNQSDALLLVDAPLTSTSESVFLPSKLIDYLGSRTPVVAITPGRGATARVVRETGGVVCPLEENSKLDELLLQTLEGGSIPSEPRSQAIDKFEYRAVGRSLAGRIEKLLS